MCSLLAKSLCTTLGALFLCLLFIAPGSLKAEEALIPDANLEAAVRMQLSRMQEPLDKADLEQLTSLSPQDLSQKIKSLEGLQYAPNLRTLIIPGHEIQQLEPLQNLKQLEFLVIAGNKVESLEALRNDTGLKRLLIDNSDIENIEPLSGLNQLTDLLMSNNRVQDLSALRGHPLRWISMSNNQVEDLSALRDIPTLQTLYADQNRISHIEVLLELPKLKEVHLASNPLDEQADAVISKLRERGVKVVTVAEEAGKPAGRAIRVILDANSVPFSSPPFITDSTAMVPFRPIFDRLGIKIAWDEKTRTISGTKDGVQLQLQIDNPVAVVNGKAVTLPAAPALIDGSTFVPVRFISEAVSAKVDWNEQTNDIIIQSKKQYQSKDGKFQFTAYGLWRDLNDEMDTGEAELAIRYFNYTMLLIYSDPKSAEDSKSNKLDSYLEWIKGVHSITKDTLLEEKKIKVLGFDAVQLTYVNNDDYDKRIDTMIVFETDSYFYNILHSSYESEYKSSMKQFQEILNTMTFHEK